MKPTGAVFFREGDGIDAKKLIAKVCDGGRVTTDGDARTATGDLVGFAIHKPRRSFWTIVDSAAGALGIAKGAWSSVAIAANHLGTDAIWYRTYAIDLALAVYFPHGGTWMRVHAGVADDILQRLDADGLPVHEAQPPATAEDALLAAVAYEPGEYDTGPGADIARQLLELHEALEAGDADAFQLTCSTITEDAMPLALGLVRGADRGAWRACIAACARRITAKPPRLRTRLPAITLDEELLRRAGEVAESDDDFTRALDHLEAIEADAGARSSHAHPAGVAKLANHLTRCREHERALACELRLVRRPKPAWYECNAILGTLLQRSPFRLDELAREGLRLVEARLPDLGQIDAIAYNLACIYARAGELERALVALRRCEDPRKQNAHPERDPDFEALWNHPEFRALIAPPPPPPPPEPVEPEEVYDVPVEHRVPRLEIDLEDREGDDGALIDRLGGKPNAPAPELAWPSSPNRPMDLVVQLVGTAGGGAIDLGDIHVLQIFADLEGEYFDADCHAVIAHRAPCVAVVEPPATVEVAGVRAMILTPGFDDGRCLDQDFELDAARSHAWCDKLFGVPVGANLDPDLRDDDDEPMRLILELMTYDDYFLWALFANRALTDFRLEIVRG
jgi:tetratricopeptide (TPR) repeat protein